MGLNELVHFTIHYSLFTIHCSPFTVHRSPFTVYRLPFTVPRLPSPELPGWGGVWILPQPFAVEPGFVFVGSVFGCIVEVFIVPGQALLEEQCGDIFAVGCKDPYDASSPPVGGVLDDAYGMAIDQVSQEVARFGAVGLVPLRRVDAVDTEPVLFAILG